MKPASAILVDNLDSVRDQSGRTVSAKLQGKVSLSDGTELPRGTVLLGKVTTDDTQQQGTSKLALRFDQARLKNGTTVPIRATIVGFYAADAGEIFGTENEDAVANDWTAKTVQLDQQDAAPGVNLHSNISSQNSGVFVATRKDDVKLKAGSQIQFAIAPASNGQNGTTAGGQS